MFRSRLVPALAVAVASAALTAGPAMARGGGSTTPAPDPAPIASYCPTDSSAWVVQLEDGSTVFANEASGAGCVFVRSYPAGYLRLDHVVLAPGWTYVVKADGEGTNSRVQVEFTETATGRKVDFRTEYGKTRIG